MTKTGIWIDKDKALVVTLKNGKERLRTIESNIEHFSAHGGSGTRLKGGPQDVVQDSKYLEREKHQLKRYFESIIPEIKDTEALVIIGPAGTNEKFSKELQKNHHNIASKIQAVEKTDSMTNNQVKAWVRTFFESKT